MSVRRAYGWIDVLRWLNRDKDIGLKFWVGQLSFEEEPAFTAPHRLGGSATNFRLSTQLELFRAAMFDTLLWRIDMPVYAVQDYVDLSFTVTSDLDFSRAHNGWTIMGRLRRIVFVWARWRRWVLICIITTGRVAILKTPMNFG